MTIHELKTWPEPFGSLWSGRKTHEYRRDDRGFAVADILVLREWEPSLDDDSDRYTGRSVVVVVTHINRGPEWGIPEGYAVMSIRIITRETGAESEPLLRPMRNPDDTGGLV